MDQDKEATIPQHRKLYEWLRTEIESGMFKAGDMLPSENELCAIHQVTRPTVRQALTALANDGFIKRQQGKGSIVNELPKGIGILSISSTTSAFSNKNLQTHIIDGPRLIAWPTDFMFQIPESVKNLGCIYLERLRLVNNEPVFYDITYLPNINLPRFVNRNFENKSLFDVLRESYRLEVKGGEQRIDAILADEKIANFFNVPTGHPVLHLDRKFDTNRVGFHFYSSIYCNTKKHSLYGTF